MKQATLFILITLFIVSGLYGIVVTPGSGPYRVGQNISFRPENQAFSYSNVANWNFGDGTTFSTTYGMETVYHTYTTPGQYTITVTDPYSERQLTESVTIRVEAGVDTRSITVSPMPPIVGSPATFRANNFYTPDNIRWDMGDGTILGKGQIRMMRKRRGRTMGTSTVTHTYTKAGTYTVRAYDWGGDTNTPVTLTVTVQEPNRQIIQDIGSPRVHQEVRFNAVNFITTSVDWNFGDGTIVTGSATTVTHRFRSAGTFTVSAKESSINHTPVTRPVTVLPENRYITVSPPEIRVNESVSVQAYNFRSNNVLWDYGDGEVTLGTHMETHTYTRSGTFTIKAYDQDDDDETVPFTATVRVKSIDDQVNLQVAEVVLDNGKHYKVVPKSSKNIRAILRMKMRGTGVISGYWEVDGRPFEYFNETVSQGFLKEIKTRDIPGLPTLEPGVHQVTVRLTRPAMDIRFPVLKYFVLPYEGIINPVTPVDGFVAKDSEIPQFSWEPGKGASRYQVAFSNHLYPIMENTPELKWITVGTELKFKPGKETWGKISRNRWSYWKVRALDTMGNVLAESDIQDIKVVIATANVTINRVTDLEGNEIRSGSDVVRVRDEDVLVHGSIEYKGDSKFLVLRVYTDKELTDQLLFREVGKGEVRHFETSIPHKGTETHVYFQVLKTSSPAVIVGIKNIIFKK